MEFCQETEEVSMHSFQTGVLVDVKIGNEAPQWVFI